MSIIGTYSEIVTAGVNASQAHTFSDKLQARNRLSILCVVFSLIYFFYFLVNKEWFPFLAISLGIFLFSTSIILNHFQKFTISSSLILFNTNYCVLFFSIYLGFDSGIHLYLFTSPLIVLTLFDTKSALFIGLALASYIVNFVILVLIEKVFKMHFLSLNESQKDIFYLINFICSSVILMALALYFLYNNNKVNQLLTLKNSQLIFQQEQLKEENSIRKIAEEGAVSSLAEREVLLSEIHHRVKNNLAVVNALMELQLLYLKDEKTIQILKESQSRVKSIALLHEKLYENKSLKEVDISSYTKDLIHFIKQSLSNKEKEIKIHVYIEKINLEMTKAMPFSLLLNELITNSYKYAFLKKDSGNIWINISEKNNDYIFEYKDDGPGFEYTAGAETTSLGINLIEGFCIQLNGTFDYQFINHEMIFKFVFPAQKV